MVDSLAPSRCETLICNGCASLHTLTSLALIGEGFERSRSCAHTLACCGMLVQPPLGRALSRLGVLSASTSLAVHDAVGGRLYHDAVLTLAWHSRASRLLIRRARSLAPSRGRRCSDRMSRSGESPRVTSLSRTALTAASGWRAGLACSLVIRALDVALTRSLLCASATCACDWLTECRLISRRMWCLLSFVGL